MEESKTEEDSYGQKIKITGSTTKGKYAYVSINTCLICVTFINGFVVMCHICE